MSERSTVIPQQRPFYTRSRFVFLFLVLASMYAYGWKVTGMDPSALARDAHFVKPLIHDLLHPDLISANTATQTTETTFDLSEFAADEPAPAASGPALTLSTRRGRVGDPLTVEGDRLKPDTAGALYWVNAIEQEFPLGSFRTDAEGRFHMDFRVPETARGDRQAVRAILTWETGGHHISHTLEMTLDKIVETLFLALMATTLSVVGAVPLSFLGARNLMARNPMGTAVYYLVRSFFNVLRSIEPLIMAILFAVWVGIGPFAGVLALALHSVAALGKLYSEQIENIDPGPVEAITATGATPLQVILYAVVPQVTLPFLAFTFYRWDINVRMSTIIGFVGGGGIGFLLQQWINLLKYREAGTALLAIAVVVIALDLLSARIRALLA
jgi:phosphonate transport system permease protein